MHVLRKKPGEKWALIEIENTLESLQQQVEGYIEAVPLLDNACVICNEEGLLKNLKFNCSLNGIQFFGTILIVGINGEEFCSFP